MLFGQKYKVIDGDRILASKQLDGKVPRSRVYNRLVVVLGDNGHRRCGAKAQDFLVDLRGMGLAAAKSNCNCCTADIAASSSEHNHSQRGDKHFNEFQGTSPPLIHDRAGSAISVLIVLDPRRVVEGIRMRHPGRQYDDCLALGAGADPAIASSSIIGAAIWVPGIDHEQHLVVKIL